MMFGISIFTTSGLGSGSGFGSGLLETTYQIIPLPIRMTAAITAIIHNGNGLSLLSSSIGASDMRISITGPSEKISSGFSTEKTSSLNL